ncbi:uncharacterized protein BP5553_00070 [Venustampulla echinocandica]|uniref:Serine aminopeptidase S33 domain-containing protein n=1 Tax=Venustampulla echinocandica TaxID=2656787 RepID=A0A370TX37_9HELO|nr:uncharacterized protein BP5553_00070 [Venustampulla echinocandica]RDL40091.1 hypothetical protein BP5553_00070 [Venustampulla echinocandica]
MWPSPTSGIVLIRYLRLLSTFTLRYLPGLPDVLEEVVQVVKLSSGHTLFSGLSNKGYQPPTRKLHTSRESRRSYSGRYLTWNALSASHNTVLNFFAISHLDRRPCGNQQAWKYPHEPTLASALIFVVSHASEVKDEREGESTSKRKRTPKAKPRFRNINFAGSLSLALDSSSESWAPFPAAAVAGVVLQTVRAIAIAIAIAHRTEHVLPRHRLQHLSPADDLHPQFGRKLHAPPGADLVGHCCDPELPVVFQAKASSPVPTSHPPIVAVNCQTHLAHSYFVLLTVLFYSRALIYPSHVPNLARTDVPRPSQFGISDFEELMIPTPDGEKLSAFYIRSPKTPAKKNITVLMFHGNAGNIGHRIPIARMFMQRMGCSVFMLEYRGYGLSTGSPDEAGLMIDAQTAYNYLRKRAETRDNDIVVFGQSLGGAVGVQLVAKNQNDSRLIGLVLENTFLSMRKLIPSIIPPAKYLTLLCHQVWASDNYMPSITEVPILFLSGLQDEIVPPSHMARLYEICQSPTKIWKPLPAGDHNSSVLEDGYFESVEDFVANLDSKRE